MEALSQLIMNLKGKDSLSTSQSIARIVSYLVINVPEDNKSEWFEEQSMSVVFALDELIMQNILARGDNNHHITFSVTAGAPGTGKGTNIASINEVFSLLKAVTKESELQLPPLLIPLVESYTGMSSSIITGTGGITNMPTGEYEILFGDLSRIIKEEIAKGSLAGDGLMTLCVKLMIFLRISQGAEKIQFDLWPRTEKQFEYYRKLVQILRQNSILVNSEIMMLRLLTTQEITATLANKEEYTMQAHQISAKIKEKLQSKEYSERTKSIETSDTPLKEKVKQLSEISQEIMASLEKIYSDQISHFVFLELHRALDRMAYRLSITLQKGEILRVDELPHIQLNRFSFFFGNTGPAFIKATDTNEIAMISSFQNPGAVVREILQSIAVKHENGAILAEMPGLWHTIEDVGAIIAEQIVKKEPLSVDRYKKELIEVLKSI